jgi:hypothetical protein
MTSLREQIHTDCMLASAVAVDIKQCCAGGIGDEGDYPDHAHRNRFRYGARHRLPDHSADHPQAEGGHGQALGESGHCPVAERHADHGKADAVAASIT